MSKFAEDIRKYAGMKNMKNNSMNKKFNLSKKKVFRKPKHGGAVPIIPIAAAASNIGKSQAANIVSNIGKSQAANIVSNIGKSQAANIGRATEMAQGKVAQMAQAAQSEKGRNILQKMKKGISSFGRSTKNAMSDLVQKGKEKVDAWKVKRDDRQKQKLKDKIALKSAVSGLPQNVNISSSGSSSNSGNKSSGNVVEIVKTTNVILETFFNLVPMLVYFISLYILAMAYINLILLIFNIIFYFFRTNDATVLYDTLRYKLLSYASIIEEYSNIDEQGIDEYDNFSTDVTKNLDGQCSASKDSAASTAHDHDDKKDDDEETAKEYTPEPVFYLFNVNFALVLINILYTLLLVLFIVCFVVVLIMKVVIPLMNPNFKTDSWENKDGQNPFTKVATSFYTYVGLIFSICLYFIYRMYFRDFMYNKLFKIKYAIKNLDAFIFKTLESTGGGNIDKSLRVLMDEKKKGNANGQYTQVNDIVLQHLQSGNVDKATQALFYFTLYANLHDNIPDSNQEAIKKINKFFFQDETNFDEALTYVSLNLNSNGVTEVRKLYMELDIFANKSSYASLSGNIDTLLGKIECKINDFNTRIIELPEIKNTTMFFGIFIVMLFIFCVLYMMSYNLIIIKNEQLKGKSSMSFIAKFVNNFLIAQFPQLGSFYLSMIYTEESALCTGLANDSSSQYYSKYSKCMSEYVKGTSR